MKLRRTLAVGAVSVAALGGFVLNAGSASATHYSGCVWEAVCLYYSPNQAGSSSSWDGAKPTYDSQNHLSAGAGQGTNVANNSASSWNTDSELHARVYADVSYAGYSQVMNILYSSTDSINFNNDNLRNKNDSHRFTLS